MTVVVVLAIAGLIALIAALMTGSTWIAIVVIVLATLGIVFLARDWRKEKTQARATSDEVAPPDTAARAIEVPPGPVTADMFKPDISTDPDGPSSNARADQPGSN